MLSTLSGAIHGAVSVARRCPRCCPHRRGAVHAALCPCCNACGLTLLCCDALLATWVSGGAHVSCRPWTPVSWAQTPGLTVHCPAAHGGDARRSGCLGPASAPAPTASGCTELQAGWPQVSVAPSLSHLSEQPFLPVPAPLCMTPWRSRRRGKHASPREDGQAPCEEAAEPAPRMSSTRLHTMGQSRRHCPECSHLASTEFVGGSL